MTAVLPEPRGGTHHGPPRGPLHQNQADRQHRPKIARRLLARPTPTRIGDGATGCPPDRLQGTGGGDVTGGQYRLPAPQKHRVELPSRPNRPAG